MRARKSDTFRTRKRARRRKPRAHFCALHVSRFCARFCQLAHEIWHDVQIIWPPTVALAGAREQASRLGTLQEKTVISEAQTTAMLSSDNQANYFDLCQLGVIWRSAIQCRNPITRPHSVLFRVHSHRKAALLMIR